MRACDGGQQKTTGRRTGKSWLTDTKSPSGRTANLSPLSTATTFAWLRSRKGFGFTVFDPSTNTSVAPKFKSNSVGHAVSPDLPTGKPLDPKILPYAALGVNVTR